MVSLTATMKNGIDFCDDTDREVDEAHGAASRVAVAFARQRRLSVSLPLDVCGSAETETIRWYWYRV